MSIFFLATETWLSESSRSFYEFWLISRFQLNFLGIFMFDLLHQDFNRVFLELSQINRLNQINRFSFSHQRVDRKLDNCREGIDWEVSNLILLLKYWCPRTHWRFLFLNHLDFHNHVSPLVEAWFLPSWSQSGRNSLGRRLGWNDVDYLPCNRNLMVGKFQKFSWTLAYLDIITQFSRNFQVRFVASRFQSSIFGVFTNQSVKK